MEFITTNRGGRKLVYQGYSYVKDSHKYEDKVVYRCDKKALNCTGRIHLGSEGNVLKEIKHLDSHHPDAAAVNALKVKHAVKVAALENREKPKAIVAKATSTTSDATAARLPAIRSMKRTIRRVRKKDHADIALPTSLEDLQIPEELTKTLKNDDFLLFDTGTESAPNRIVAFGTQRFFDQLVSAKEVYADGTFKIVPAIFTQLYVIHSFDGEQHLPCVYALLPNKTKPTYKLLLQKLVELSDGKFNPNVVLSDFEAGFINAVKEVFPDTTTKGCFFHLSQNLMKHVQREKTVYDSYKEDDEYATKIKMITALAFLPTDDVRDGFAELAEILPQECDGLYRYFKNSYIGDESVRPRGGRGRLGATAAEFPIPLWNMHDRTLANLPRTNNSSEGFNNGLGSLANGHHINFFSFIEVLQSEQALQEVELTQHQIARPPIPKRQKYVRLNDRLKRLIELYNNEEIDVVEFLRRVALNLVL